MSLSKVGATFPFAPMKVWIRSFFFGELMTRFDRIVIDLFIQLVDKVQVFLAFETDLVVDKHMMIAARS